MKWLLSLLTVLLLLLQYKLWVGDGGIPDVLHLQQEVEKQQQQKKQLEERNASLAAEVTDLKQGLDAIEERARSELGMIRKDEHFYQIIHSPDHSAAELSTVSADESPIEVPTESDDSPLKEANDN